MKRLITSFALTMLVMLGAGIASAQTETLTLTPRNNAVEAGQIVSVGGAGSVFNLVVQDSGLFNGNELVSYTATATDTTATVASSLVNAINSDSQLQTLGVKAKAGTGGQYTITSSSTNATTYTESVGGTGGVNQLFIQETLSLGGTVHSGDVLTLTVHDAGLSGGQDNVSVSGSSIAALVLGLKNAVNADSHLSGLGIKSTFGPNALTIVIESGTYDTAGHITSYSVSTTGSETMTLGDFFGTNGVQKITVGGTVTAGDVVGFRVNNSALSGGTEQVAYTVQNSDSLLTIASGLAAAVNADTNLANIGVSATAASGVLSINSNSAQLVGVVAIAQTCPHADASPNDVVGTWPTGSYSRVCNNAVNGQTLLNALQNFNMQRVGDAVARLNGTAATVLLGDKPTLTFLGPALGTGHSVTHTLAFSETPGTIANELTTAINQDQVLMGLQITAIQSGATITILDPNSQVTGHNQKADNGSGGTDPDLTLTPGTDGQGRLTWTVGVTQGAADNTFYNFPNAATYNNVATTDPPNHKTDVTAGSTGTTTPTSPYHSALFDTYIPSGQMTPANNPNPAHTVYHETGHELDRIYSQQGILVGTSRASQSQLFQNSFNADWAALQNANIQPCKYQDNGGIEFGLFSTLQDQRGNYFCDGTNGTGQNLQGRYAGQTPIQIIQLAWPWIFNSQSGAEGNMAEVFSELFAFHTTIATPAATPVDLWFRGLQLTGQGGGFYCSLNLTFNLFQTGTIQPFNSDVVLPSMNDSVQYNCPQQ